jgi:hypothetical protein
MILPEDIIEGSGAVFSGEDLVTHERDCKACAGIDNLIYAQNAVFFSRIRVASARTEVSLLV